MVRGRQRPCVCTLAGLPASRASPIGHTSSSFRKRTNVAIPSPCLKLLSFHVIYDASTLALPSALEQPWASTLVCLSVKTAALVLTLSLEIPSGLFVDRPGSQSGQSALLSVQMAPGSSFVQFWWRPLHTKYRRRLPQPRLCSPQRPQLPSGVLSSSVPMI